jgi:hypothetical protein
LFDATTQEKLFVEYITPGVQAEIKARSKLWDMIQKSDKVELGGLYARVKMLMAASQSSRASSSAAYPTAAESTPAEGKVYLKRAQMFTLKFDGMAMELAAKKGTPIAPEEFEKKGIFITVADDMSRQLWGDGSGIFAYANGAGSGATSLIVDHSKYANLAYFLKPGRIIDGVTAGSKEIDSNTVTAFDADTQTATITSDSWTDDAALYNEDVYTASEGAGLGEMMGLQGIIRATDPPAPNSSAGLQGLLVATYPEWKAHVKSNSGVDREISEDLIVSALDDAMEYGNVSVLLTTLKVRRAYADLLEAYKTLPNAEMLWGGWSGLAFVYDGKKIPLVPDRFCPDGDMYGLDESRLSIFCTDKKAQISWERGFGGQSAILQKVAGYNQYQAEGHIFSNLGTDLRKAFVVINDIDESSFA